MDQDLSFPEFYRSLSEAERKAYADKAGTTPGYIETHLVSTPPRKIPRPKLMRGLADASGGRVSQQVLLRHFYQPGERNPISPQQPQL
jgi:hypothetical protein